MSLFKLYNYFEDSNYVYLVLEMCHNGEMSRYLKERKMPFSEDEGLAELFYFKLNMKYVAVNGLVRFTLASCLPIKNVCFFFVFVPQQDISCIK